MSVIEVCGLTKYFNRGRCRGVDGMSFSVERGEMFGLVGPNGAGKSTTIRILMNLLYPDSGSARICGLDCARSSREVKRLTGYMPSEVRCYAETRAGALLDYACKLRGLERGAWRGWAERFDLDAHKRFGELSLGNRRKLSIVQALVGSPRLLILDEPTSGLDPLMQDAFFGALEEAQSAGTTVLFSSHNLSEVQRHCSRVALVRGGRVAATPDMNALKQYHVRLRTEADLGALLKAVHARGVRREGASLSFLIDEAQRGELLRALAQLELSDVEIARPTLDAMLRELYAEGGADA
ncbi:MAG: ABC transporter ATP-binding protein [Candidatus Fimadaptatus sp.]